MSIKVFLDDKRQPFPGWRIARTVDEMLAYMGFEDVGEISLDHDLGPPPDGIVVLDKIRYLVHNDENYKPPIINIHTANPKARENMVKLAVRIQYDVYGKHEILGNVYRTMADDQELSEVKDVYPLRNFMGVYR